MGHFFQLVLDIIIILLLFALIRDYWKHKKAGYKVIKPETFKSMYESQMKNCDFIDCRMPHQYAKEKVFKSRNMNIYGVEFKKGLETLDRRKTYILFSDKTSITKHAAYQFRKEGIQEVFAVKGNWKKIKATGVPLRSE